MLTRKQQIWTYAGIIVVFVLGSASLAYLTSSQDPITASFKRLYPAALVGGNTVSIQEADEFINLAQKMDPQISKAAAFNNFLKIKKSEALMQDLDIKLESDTVPDELTFFKKGNDAAYNMLLQTYFDNSEAAFTRNVVVPQAVEAKLRLKYNSDLNLNQAAYAEINGVLIALSTGEKFEDLAKQSSDDKQTCQYGGDLGFFEHGQILPELEKQITISKAGEVNMSVVTSRYGYHVVYPIEVASNNGVKSWHAKHILVETAGFDKWLEEQTRNISVKTLKSY